MRRSAMLLPLLLLGGLACGQQAHADPARFAIMGVRLNMTAQDVLTTLYAQGAKPDAVRESVHPCPLHQELACTTRITAPLPDGVLDIRFTDVPPGFNDGREAAMAISYTLRRSAPSAEELEHVADGLFGPIQASGSAWSAKAPAEAGCTADAPLMRVSKAADGSEVLSLADLGLPARLAPALQH